ncbi:hypothetical protein DZF99_02715 [Clavibacter phaseoli]|nr:hypothetical protein DZF99_02715 [Clavibacter phaseoli]
MAQDFFQLTHGDQHHFIVFCPLFEAPRLECRPNDGCQSRPMLYLVLMKSLKIDGIFSDHPGSCRLRVDYGRSISNRTDSDMHDDVSVSRTT